jgi:hypothetical protein
MPPDHDFDVTGDVPPFPTSTPLVELWSDVTEEHVADMALRLRQAIRWSLDRRSMIPTLRYDHEDGLRRVIVVENAPVFHLPRREDAPATLADLVRDAILVTLDAPRCDKAAMKAAETRLGGFAAAAARAIRLERPHTGFFWSATPWHPAMQTVRTGTPEDREIEIPAHLVALAPNMVSIGTSQDSSMADVSIGLYGHSVIRGPADAMEALRGEALLHGR